ncbi:PSP1-domain-containing protein [Daedalea quercina L-15889]|uniref:PSP1-domain-containing protein n=1 Tax=Daedalea quercina L-15889 TaxID=1314783 RepID=A0A165L6Z4_9APHY|nr:PSP1-domain-containing protein [Daedalea quercina L-15889]
MASLQGNHQQYSSDDADRKNRFLSDHGTDTPNSLRERAASQPPRSTSQGFTSSSMQPMRNPSGSVWPRLSGLNPNSINGALPSSVPTRSVSFSSSPPSHAFSSAMRDSRFASTFEDDESEALSDIQDYDPYDPYIDDRYSHATMSNTRGRTYAADLTRSRSQSLATARPGALGGGMSPHGSSGLWSHNSFSGAKDIPSSRYGDLKPPGSSRYGSLGALGRSPSSGYGSITDPSNMSPFRRDVGQILLDDGSAFRELYTMHPPRDENGGGGSGTTSRRHSVSVVQPRRPTIVGFNAPGGDGPEEMSRPGAFQSASFAGGGGLMLTDDDLASDLNTLNLRDEPRTSSSMLPPSQPSSLPIYAPLSRSPPSADRLSPYQSLHLNIPNGSYASRQSMGSPSESGLSGGSPGRGHMDSIGRDSGYASLSGETSRATVQGLARFIPGQGIQNIPEQSMLQTPISPIGLRSSHYAAAPQIQRRASDAASNKTYNDLGRGVPLHSVPTSWPLYIIEFKAGRTDLFYSTDVAPDIRVGDLVIVEADRGKDLGKVINDTITLAEVEAFQKQQKLMNYADVHGVPTSPTATGPPTGKEINPKRIYGKAQPQDTQLLAAKLQDETKALELCKNKVRQRKLPMEVVDAEYQWDRRKLTFYFIAEKRIDFRELVRELFRLYKTRIWMASLGGPGGYEQ